MTLRLGIRMPNWLGDAILTLPTLNALREKKIKFELFGKPWLKDVFSAYDETIHALPKDYWQTRQLYINSHITHCLLLTNSLSSAAHLCFTGIKTIGYRAHGRGILLDQAAKKINGLHESEYFWRLANVAMSQQLAPIQPATLCLASTYRDQATLLIQQAQIPNKFIVICPGALGRGKNGTSKVWPQWYQLTTRLAEQGQTMIACPAPYELDFFKQILSSHVRILPNLNIPLYAAVMQQSSQVIANDSGPMHLAAAVNAPVLGIFGVSDPQRCRPLGGTFIGSEHTWPDCEQVLARLQHKNQ